MERRLGVDMEHEGDQVPDEDSDDSGHSAQTNEVIEGYAEANYSPKGNKESIFLIPEKIGNRKRTGSIFIDEYKSLSKK